LSFVPLFHPFEPLLLETSFLESRYTSVSRRVFLKSPCFQSCRLPSGKHGGRRSARSPEAGRCFCDSESNEVVDVL
jgi:hypothetical protein